MKTVWAIASWTFTGTFVSMLLMILLHETSHTDVTWQLERGAFAAWFGAAGIAGLAGWHAIVWRPIPNKLWSALVLLVANVVFAGGLLMLLAGGFPVGMTIVG